MLFGVVLGAVIASCGGDDDTVAPGTGGGGSGGTGGKGGAGTGGSTSTGGGGSGGATAGSSGTAGSAGSAATDGGGGASSNDASDGGQTLVQRGEYLVKHVAACGDCHTPRTNMGALDMTKWLAGVPNFADIDPGSTTQGSVSSKNLTPHATGLLSWTDTQIKQAFLEGVSKDGTALFPIMPYFVFHNMAERDADAIVAYLRTIPPIDNAIPARQPLGFPFPLPAQPVPTAYIPSPTIPSTDPNYASAMRGKYLAGHVGVCMECHTEPSAQGTPIPLDVNKLFLGNRVFHSAGFGLPPGFPADIYTRNLTPHANGIAGWTAAMVRTALKQGIDKDGIPLCPPMPAGPMQAFGGLTDQDALDIGNYIVNLAPRDNGVIPNCVPPAPPDGGASDASHE